MSDSTPKVNGDNEKLSSALNEIFSNPQMLSAISSMAQSLKSGENSAPSPAPNVESEPQANDTANPISDKLPELLNMLSVKSSNASRSQRSELLCALKPYLSQSRSDAIDKIIRFSELSSVLKNLS